MVAAEVIVILIQMARILVTLEVLVREVQVTGEAQVLEVLPHKQVKVH
jgi:hypothetical protein